MQEDERGCVRGRHTQDSLTASSRRSKLDTKAIQKVDPEMEQETAKAECRES